jgi:hypothetical protein
MVAVSHYDAALRDTGSGVWCVGSGSIDGMSDGTGSTQFGRVDSGSWEKDISQLVFMKSGIPPPDRSGATSFWKLQDSTETDHAGNSGMFDSVGAASNSLVASTCGGGDSAGTSNITNKSDSAPADTHAMESPEHLLLERAVTARTARSAVVDSGSSIVSMLEPRDRNSAATEFRSSSGTDLQVCDYRSSAGTRNITNRILTASATGPLEYDEYERAHKHWQLRYCQLCCIEFQCFQLRRRRCGIAVFPARRF